MTFKDGQSEGQKSQPMESLRSDKPPERTDLGKCYREIGIEAVAAAARYAGPAKRASDAPGASQIDQRFIEVAI